MEGNLDKRQGGFERHHSTMDHLVKLMIIGEECRKYNKHDLFCCIVYFIKSFERVPTNNLWNRLEELKVLTPRGA